MKEEEKIDYYYHCFINSREESEFSYIDSFIKESSINASIIDNGISRIYRIPTEDLQKLYTPYNETGPYYLKSKYKRYPVFPFRSLSPLVKKEELNWKMI